MYKELIEYLNNQIAYCKNQNLVTSNKERLSADDYKWMAANNAEIANLTKWIRMLESAGKGE